MKKFIILSGILLSTFLLSACADYTLVQIRSDAPGNTFCEFIVLQVKNADDRLLVNVGDTICIACNSNGVCINPNASETFEVKTFDTKMTLQLVNATCGSCTHLFAFKVE